MPVIATIDELIAALRGSVLSPDPMNDLNRRGFTLSPELEAQWKKVSSSRKPAAPPSIATLPPSGTTTFQTPAALKAPAAPPPGSYDAVAGLTLLCADKGLSAAYLSGAIPHEVPLDQILSHNLLTALDGFFLVDKPGGVISRLHLTAAPIFTTIPGVSSDVGVVVPFQIDWTHTTVLSGVQIRKLITTAVGTLQLTMRIDADVDLRPRTKNSTLAIVAHMETEAKITAANSPLLTLDPKSPVQRKSPPLPGKIDGVAVIIQNAIAQQLIESVTISPHIPVPVGNLDIRHVDVVAKDGALIAGIQVVGTQGTGIPDTLTNLAQIDSNLFLQVQEIVPDLVIQEALRNGDLTRAAREKHSNAVVDSATARFDGDALVIESHGRLVDECPFNVDLAFISTRTVTFEFLGTKVNINQSDDNSILDKHNLLCLLASLGFIGLAALAGAVYEGIGAVVGGTIGFFLTNVGPFLLDQIFDSSNGSSAPTPLALPPIPGTDFRFTLTGGDFRIKDGAMTIGVIADTLPDTINTAIYARFVTLSGSSTAATKPLARVKVELKDQDSPPPPGDDATTTPPAKTVTKQGNVTTVTEFSYLSPTSDEKLAEGTTDFEGVVRFGLLKEQLKTTAGRMKVTQTKTEGFVKTVRTITPPVVEQKPDLYFLITMPDGSTVDSRKFQNGFMPNFVSSRVGSLEHPLVITIGPTGTTT